ncbi:Uu.00g047860.m01.CDS01 [Anthostomella pinea]|uniref:Uu.00g047860.m01.CDS01 n=1 Tax=Anthostomella pinea TaxID=933095 RepID=A0AAI8YES2_9PEZI|nr:Uu.00g047860.m01.CDS01 [Anthostomella pinea]
MPKATTPKSRRGLEDDYLATGPLRSKPQKRKSRDLEDRDEKEGYVDSKASQNILRIGRELAAENDAAPPRTPQESNAFGFESRFDQDDNDEKFDDEVVWGDDDEEEVEEVEIEPEDLDTFNRFLPGAEDPASMLIQHGWGQDEPQQEQNTTNLADIILARIAAHEAGEDRAQGMEAMDDVPGLSPKIVEVYEKVGEILSRYKSGKLPKPFKILPTVPNWETIIEITKPDQWTPNACYAATKIFVSSKPIVVRRFMEMILLDRVREDIHETKKLNVHLFNALKKAAWFKGFLFPLVESGTCTLREAAIISAVLVRVSVPVLHSGAALKGLCEIAAREASAGTEGGGATTICDALPYQVVDSLVFFFLRMRSVDPASVTDKNTMDLSGERASTRARLPVLWHQALLSFAQRYKHEITEDQREALLDLLLSHGHAKIGPEIRRELLAGRGRGIVAEPETTAFDGDDTMLVDG